MFEVMKEINKAEVKAPVNIGDIVIPHVLGTDANVIITKKMERV
jgi:CxxC motif-containing protein